MTEHLPIWHEVEPLEKAELCFVIGNLQAGELALPIIESPTLAIGHAHVIFLIAQGNPETPREAVEAHKRGVLTAILRNDEAAAQIAVTDTVHVFTRESFIGIDFEDFRILVANSTSTTLPHLVAGSATANSQSNWSNALDFAVQRAEHVHVNCIRQSSGVLIIISFGKGCLSLATSKLIFNALRGKLNSEAFLLYGLTHDESIGAAIRITILAAL